MVEQRAVIGEELKLGMSVLSAQDLESQSPRDRWKSFQELFERIAAIR